MRNTSLVSQVTEKATARSEDARAHTRCVTAPVPLPAAGAGALPSTERRHRVPAARRGQSRPLQPRARLLGESSSPELPSFQPQQCPRSGADPPLTRHSPGSSGSRRGGSAGGGAGGTVKYCSRLTHFSSWTAAQSFHPLLSPLVSRLSEKRGSRGREQPASPCQGHGPQQPLLPGKGRMPEGAAFLGNCGVAGSACARGPALHDPLGLGRFCSPAEWRGHLGAASLAQAQGWLLDQLSLLLWE